MVMHAAKQSGGHVTEQQPKVDEIASRIIEQLDTNIAEFEARGWLQAAATAESLVCQIYANFGLSPPTPRFEMIAACLSLDLVKTKLQ